jgi:hypothetical protein
MQADLKLHRGRLVTIVLVDFDGVARLSYHVTNAEGSMIYWSCSL